MNCNTESMNSWHSWSPNSRWIVFSSKLFSPYTQLFLTHIDENGIDAPPVLLENILGPDKAANIPEFVNIEPGSNRRLVEEFVDDNTFLRHGLRLEAFDRLDEAEEQLIESLRLNPDNAESRLVLGIIYARKAQFNQAEEVVGAIPESDPMFYRALYVLGGIYAQGGRFPEAIEVYRQSLTVSNDDPFFEANVRFNLGRSLVFLERYDEATEEFQTVLRLEPERAEALAHLGNIKLRKGDESGAIRDFERALEVNPSLPGLREMLDELRRRGNRG
jgi:tetratricopeptide (TPR) repeat protein